MSVVILLSTYNGTSFLESQINTLLTQDYYAIDIQIRDDGSTDGTHEILSRFANNNTNINCRFEDNIGVVNSFFDLLKNCGESFDYYSFCDQDDYWQPNKISSAIKKMDTAESEIPILYFSRLEHVNDKLAHLEYSTIPERISFEHAIVENLATGCTIIINRSARKLLLNRLPDFALMHDWWMFIVISALGKLIYDPESYILYRQHSSNVVGGTTNRFKANLKRFIPFIASLFNPTKKRTSDQLIEFKRLYIDKLDTHKLCIIDEFLDAKSDFMLRFRLVASGRYRRQNTFDNILFSILIITGHY